MIRPIRPIGEIQPRSEAVPIPRRVETPDVGEQEKAPDEKPVSETSFMGYNEHGEAERYGEDRSAERKKLVNICSTCKKIKVEIFKNGAYEPQWREAKPGELDDCDFSHGCCPDCFKKEQERAAEMGALFAKQEDDKL